MIKFQRPVFSHGLVDGNNIIGASSELRSKVRHGTVLPKQTAPSIGWWEWEIFRRRICVALIEISKITAAKAIRRYFGTSSFNDPRSAKGTPPPHHPRNSTAAHRPSPFRLLRWSVQFYSRLLLALKFRNARMLAGWLASWPARWLARTRRSAKFQSKITPCHKIWSTSPQRHINSPSCCHIYSSPFAVFH